MTPAQTYAAGFARWRARMPRHMQDPATSTRYWLDTVNPGGDRNLYERLEVGRSMDRMFDCTYGERVQTRRRRWR